MVEDDLCLETHIWAAGMTSASTAEEITEKIKTTEEFTLWIIMKRNKCEFDF